ncbi:hypothetical protein [Coxiella endosymbiont of Ornithodoros maritimus]|nr:hypothetical protein [Coxiella endosymbiont of Ornithodoros maritimus]
MKKLLADFRLIALSFSLVWANTYDPIGKTDYPDAGTAHLD